MNVRLEKDGALAILTLDRPDRLNAMADPMWDALHGHLATRREEWIPLFVKIGIKPQ